jgi:LacI family transcriptional regulator
MAKNRRRRRFALPHIALIVETSAAYGGAILAGVSQYLHECGPWTVYIEQRSLQDPAPPCRASSHPWGGQGIIA